MLTQSLVSRQLSSDNLLLINHRAVCQLITSKGKINMEITLKLLA